MSVKMSADVSVRFCWGCETQYAHNPKWGELACGKCGGPLVLWCWDRPADVLDHRRDLVRAYHAVKAAYDSEPPQQLNSQGPLFPIVTQLRELVRVRGGLAS